ncbi:MAG TPA: carboxypeptidase regulatory-like domain-containing protein [Bryobacteraceae bacterium]|nr:carboxypeptidase regulatory-like domain-containing protein [Bryobacteraceae bacterium]
MRRNEFRLRTRCGLVLILVTALLAVMTPTGLAQEVTGAITGKITDSSGGAIVGATVNAKDVDRGTVWKASTNEEGVYNLPRLPIGRYEVRAEAGGFQTAVHAPFNLELNQTAKIDIVMTIGQVSQSVEVSGAAPLLQTQTTELGTVMDSHSIGALPLETRNYNQLALLMPGAVATSPGSFNTGQKTFNAGRPNINGNREQANYYILDGMDNNEFVDNNVAYSPNIDAIQEFNVITNNPSAEFGHFLGGVINVSTKSGTNQFHGDLFEYLRNDFFNANEWSRNFNGLPTQRQRWNEFGGTVGGPIRHDKLFFFADYQGSRFDTPASAQTITTFTAQQLTGNFSDIQGLQLHYPGTTVPMPANLNQAAICAAGQQMGSAPCITGLSPTAFKILAALPKATRPGLINNADNTQQTYTHGNQGDIKADWMPTEKDHIFARYTQQHIEQPTINSQPLLYNSNGNNLFPLQSAVLDHTRTISASLLNDLRVGFNYYPAEANTQSSTAAAGAGLIPGQPTAFLPGLYFAGSPVGGGQNGPFPFGTTDSPEVFHQTAIQVSDTAIFTRGLHTFKFGFQLQRYRNNYIPATSNDGAAGQVGFSGQYTGSAETDFLLGLPSYMAYGQGFAGTVGQRNDAIGAFFQDDWRLTPKLTINLGLRWQVFTPIYEVHDRMTNFGEYTGQIELAGQNGNSRALYNQYNGIANFLPRLGIAWTPWGDKTVIRAAFSRSSFWEGTGEYNRLATNAPWNVDLVGTFAAGTNGTIPANQVTLDQGFGGLGAAGGGTPCNVTTVLSVPASCFAGVRIHATDPGYRPAVSNQWNLTLQHQLSNSLTLQAAYVGQHTDHMAAIYNMGQNVLFPNGTSIPGPYLSGNSLLKNIGTGQQRLNTSTGIQNYDALQLTAQQRLARGLSYQFNYTWQKCLTNNQGYYGRYGDAQASQASADVSFQEYVYNTRLDYGLCDRDVTSVFTGYVNYDLPFGHDRKFKTSNKAVNAVAGDWMVSSILTFHGGFPISMLDYSADPTGAFFQPRPDCLSPSVATPFKNYAGGGYIWFDPTTMRDPATGKLGNCPISSERGPGLRQIDLSLSKKFRITERQNLEFRFDAINAFNSPIFTVQGYQIDIFSNAYSLMTANGGPCTSSTATCVRNPSALTGVVNSSLGARNLQFALKYTF